MNNIIFDSYTARKNLFSSFYKGCITHDATTGEDRFLFINNNAELGITLNNVLSELNFKCTMLEEASIAIYLNIGKEDEEYLLKGLNQFLGTNFDINDIKCIASYFGRKINRAFCEIFVKSYYDLNLLIRNHDIV